MNEMLRKFGSEHPDNNTPCADCLEPYGGHSGHYCPSNLPPPEIPRAKPTEMTSLREIRAALTRIEQRLTEHDEWAKATNKVLSAEARNINEARFKEFQEAATKIGGLLVGLHKRLDKLKVPGAAPAKRRSGKGRK